MHSPAPTHPLFEVLCDSRQIHAAVQAVADSLRPFVASTDACLVVVLEGARRFAHDLVACLHRPCDLFPVRARSYEGTCSSGRVELEGLGGLNLAGRSVVIVDDILDTGRTLAALTGAVRRMGAAEVRTCVLIVKDAPRAADVPVDYAGLRVGNRFVVGYGLDFEGRYRELDCIAALSRTPAPEGARSPSA